MVICGIIIPQILLIAFRKRLFDEPDERKIHKGAVPRLGGLAFMPSIVFSLCFVSGLLFLAGENNASWDMLSVKRVLNSVSVENQVIPVCFGLCALMVMYLVGIADDLIGVKYRAKFVAQILAGLLFAAADVRLNSLGGMLGIYELPVVISWVLTVFLVVFIVNAINLIDGIDGLASGLSGIAMAFYGLSFYAADQFLYGMVAFAGLGTLVPFFYYNVFGNALRRKKIFMGDTIPCLDVVRVFVHRVIRGNSPFLPDRVHIHHKLLALGIPQRVAMVVILGASAGLIALNLILSPMFGPFMIVVTDLLIWVVVNFLLTKKIRGRQKRGRDFRGI